MNTAPYEVNGWNNFCRVFELPEEYPSDYCHDGGHRVNFQLVDWFYPVPGISQAAISKKEWREEVGEIETKEVTTDELKQKLVPWLQNKRYMKADREYLVICDFGVSFTFKS